MRLEPGLIAALLLYMALGVSSVKEVGVVGEVELAWALPQPPRVLVTLDPVQSADGADPNGLGHRWGPLVASQSRPVERLELGGCSLPLAINQHTGGLSDWPSRLLRAAGLPRRGVIALHVGLGALILAGLYRFVRAQSGPLAATVAAGVLASDWSFVFYKKVLGGTELLLQAALLLCLVALWSRRWGSGRQGLLLFALGAGLGLQAKLTFAFVLGPLLLTALLLRGDKPAMRPPLPERWGRVLGLPILLTAPIWGSLLHHALAVPASPHIWSHDFGAVQRARLLAVFSGEGGPAREGLGNLLAWAVDPLRFFEVAYGVAGASQPSVWRAIGLLGVALGAALAWRDRHPTPRDALLRFAGLWLLLSLGLVGGVARDLHHLALLAPLFALVAGLSIEALASLGTAARSLPRARNALILALPLVIGGVSALRATDGVIARVPVPTFTESGQAALVALLREAEVKRLILADYEAMGVFEELAPDIAVEHAWGAVSQQGRAALPALLERAVGGHLLVLRASAPMVYNLAPRAVDLAKAATPLGLVVEPVGALPGQVATLYAVSRAGPPP